MGKAGVWSCPEGAQVLAEAPLSSSGPQASRQAAWGQAQGPVAKSLQTNILKGAGEQAVGGVDATAEAAVGGADGTASWRSVLLPGVPFPVANETRAVGEGFPAFLTLIRLLSSVSFLMFQEIRAAVKGFPTLTAFKGLLSRVDSLVFGDVGAVPKGLPTLIALEGLLSGVNSLMADVICLVLEDASTLTALVGFFSLKRDEHRNPLEVIFKRSVEGIEDVGFILGTQAGLLPVLFSHSSSPAGPFPPRHLLVLGSVPLHHRVLLWALCLLLFACGLFHLSVPRRAGVREASYKGQGERLKHSPPA